MAWVVKRAQAIFHVDGDVSSVVVSKDVDRPYVRCQRLPIFGSVRNVGLVPRDCDRAAKLVSVVD